MKYDIHKISTITIPDVLTKYISYMGNVQGKSQNTIDGYKIDIIMFFRYLKLYRYIVPSDTEFETIDISDIDDELIRTIKLEDLHAFLKFTEEYRNNSSLTRARKVAVLKSFFKFIHDKLKLIDDNPTLELEAPKQSRKQPIYLSLHESEKLLLSVDGRNTVRDFCIITVFLNCGLRLSELCNIKLHDIRNDILIVTGKGDKERSIYLNEVCLKAIDEYKVVRNLIADIKTEDYLFISEQRTNMNQRTVQNLVKKFIIQSGLDPKKYSVHKLRHTSATLLYKYGKVDIRSLQIILGHENIATTTIYTHVDEEQIRTALKSNPLNNNKKN